MKEPLFDSKLFDNYGKAISSDHHSTEKTEFYNKAKKIRTAILSFFLLAVIVLGIMYYFLFYEDPFLKPFDKSSSLTHTSFHNGDARITAEDLYYTDDEAILVLKVENLGENEIVISSNRSTSINGYMVEHGLLFCRLAPDESRTEKISFDIAELNFYGINSISEIEMFIDVLGDGDRLNPKKFTIKTTSSAKFNPKDNPYKHIMDKKLIEKKQNCNIKYYLRKVLFDQYRAKLNSVALIEKNNSLALFLEIDNTLSSSNIFVAVEDLEVNGYSASNSKYLREVTANKDIVIVIPISQLILNSGISAREISEISFTFSCGDEPDDMDDEEIVISLPDIKIPTA